MATNHSINNECYQPKRSIQLLETATSQLTNFCQSYRSPSYPANDNQGSIIKYIDSLSEWNYLKNLDPIKIPPVFTTGGAALYTRYTPKDWWNFEYDQFTNANEILNGSERLIKESEYLAREIDEQTWKNQLKSTNEISNIQQEITFWKNEIQKIRQKLYNIINKLELKRQEIEHSLKSIQSRLKIAQENLYEREKRQNIDLVHDTVERELITLIDILTNARRPAENGMFEQIDKQIYLNRRTLNELEAENENKFNALILENAAMNITNTLPCVYDCKTIAQVDVTYLNWLKRTKTIIEQAYCEITASNDLIHTKTNIPCIEQNIFDQWQIVGIALEQRIHEMNYIRNRLQDQFNRIHENILNTEKTIEFLKKTIRDKEMYMKVIQCRLSLLSMRPILESINDREYPKLLQECNDLQCSIDQLHRSLYQEENALQHLYRLKATIEEDLVNKNNSLFIDEQKVEGLRNILAFSLQCPTQNEICDHHTDQIKSSNDALSYRHHHYFTHNHPNRSHTKHFLC